MSTIMEREVARIEKAFSEGKSYEEVMTPNMISKYKEKKYGFGDKLVELILKEQNKEITYTNKNQQIKQMLTSRRLFGGTK